jgi:glucokinase
MSEFGRWVALGLVNLTNLLDPDVVVIGGGLAQAGGVVLDPVRRHFGDLLYAPEHRPHPRLVLASLGERAGAIGAALLGRAGGRRIGPVAPAVSDRWR